MLYTLSELKKGWWQGHVLFLHLFLPISQIHTDNRSGRARPLPSGKKTSEELLYILWYTAHPPGKQSHLGTMRVFPDFSDLPKKPEEPWERKTKRVLQVKEVLSSHNTSWFSSKCQTKNRKKKGKKEGSHIPSALSLPLLGCHDSTCCTFYVFSVSLYIIDYKDDFPSRATHWWN